MPQPHLQGALALLLEFYVTVARGVMFHVPQDTEHAGTLHLVVSMGRDNRRQEMEHCDETSLRKTDGTRGTVAPHMRVGAACV